ncbi:MAG: hypothetical protein SOV90_06840 [Lachnospiraceae bacterium]|nr:hypothetical protein [Lachnospiraceae bacterium]
MKRIFKQETVMLVSLCLVLLVVMFGATVAWFEGITPASIKEMDIKADDLGDLYVWVKVDDENTASAGELGTTASAGEIDDENYAPLKSVGTGDNIKYSIDLDIAKQENIEDNTLAPGAYGTVKFKILSKTSRTTGYAISVTPSIELIDGYENIGSGLTEEEFKKLVESHLKFYATYDDDSKEYEDVIPYSDECLFLYNEFKGIKGDVNENEIKYVTLYWYWPYEFTDIPNSLDIYNEDSDFYEEFKKYTFSTMTNEKEEIVNIRREISESIEAYDWDDTYIGNYVQSLKFHFDVESLRK